MRKRLYYVVPDRAHAEQMFHHLLLAQVEARHIHVLARDDIDLGDELPAAGLNQRTDVLHGAVQGILYGGLSGAVLGVLLLLNPPETMALNQVVVLLLTLLGAAFGAWVASLIGLNIGNTQLSNFEADIQAGRILIMVDVPRRDLKRISAIVRKDDPDAVPGGMEPTMPAFP